MAANVDDALLTNISEMIDLAIGTPEVGVVDFNMLQTVLHCLAQQLRVLGKNVELRGSIAVLPVGRSTDNSQTIAISEFIVDTGVPGKYKLATEPPSPEQESMLVVERRRRTAPQNVFVKTGEGSTQPTLAPRSAGHVSSSPPALVVSPATPPATHGSTLPTGTTRKEPGPSAEKLSLVTLSKFNLLENTVADLKDRVYGTSPKNEEILQEVRSQGNLKAITDLWTNMNVASRLDAAEEGIGKLSSLIEDLIGETAEIKKTRGAPLSPATIKMAETANALSSAATSKHAPSGHGIKDVPSQPVPSQTAPIQAAPSFDHDILATKDELWQLLGHVQTMRDDLNELTTAFSDAMKDVKPDFVAPKFLQRSKIELIAPEVVVVERPAAGEVVATSTMVAPPSDAAAPKALAAPSAMVAPSAVVTPSAMVAPGRSASVSDTQQANLTQLEARLLERLAYLENEIKKCCDSVTKTDGKVQDQMTSFQDQLEYMANQITGLALQGADGKLSPDLVKDLQGLMKLFETVQNMQAELQQVHETALNLAAEKKDRQSHIDALLEQIELLKVIKLDREDMVEALADKADLRMLARKVSHDQFENACDDLSKGLEHALGKLNVQESLWQQALDDIQREIEQKLDKMELSPVKDFFNNKLKQLQENLKQMAALRREAEAAGTKRRLLRDVNCISCDAKAVMAMDPPPPLASKPLPASLSMKPYLSYELDAIRRSQASSLPQRNMHDWERVQQQMQPSKPHKVRSETDKHLCNRYCGGSHTVTTPAQRVARLGHFIKQWGPEVLPLSSGFAAGDDGRLYKISTSEGANVGTGGAVEGAAVCTPRSPVKKPEPPKGPKPIVISALQHASFLGAQGGPAEESVTTAGPPSKSIFSKTTKECRCLDPTADRPSPKN